MKYITNTTTAEDRCSPTNVPFEAVTTQDTSNVNDLYLIEQDKIIEKEKRLNDRASRGLKKYW
jgi:hypothetical protein